MGARVEEIEAVYRRDFDRFLAVAVSIVGDEDVAYDVVQDAFARALRHRRGFRRRGPVAAWLWRTVVNAARTARAGAVPAAEPARNGGPPADAGPVRALVAALPERQRLALFLHYYADLGYTEIAEVMDVSPGTVGATLNAARATLRERLVKVER
jgi:RNA polymerase sigma-70 factor (ECF subfamily)